MAKVEHLSPTLQVMCSNAVYGTIGLNTAAMIYACNVVDEIAERPELYRHKVKHSCKAMERADGRWTKALLERLKGTEYIYSVQDFGLEIYKGMEADITRLNFAIRNAIGRHKADNIPLMADVITMKFLLELATAYTKKGIDTLSGYVMRTSPHHMLDATASLRPLMIADALRHAQDIHREICRTAKGDGDVELYKDESISNGIKALLNRISTGDVINKAIDKCINKDSDDDGTE